MNNPLLLKHKLPDMLLSLDHWTVKLKRTLIFICHNSHLVVNNLFLVPPTYNYSQAHYEWKMVFSVIIAFCLLSGVLSSYL